MHVAVLVEEPLALILVARHLEKYLGEACSLQRKQSRLLMEIECAALRSIKGMGIAFEHSSGDAMDVKDEATERLRRLYKAVEDGVAEMDDILKDRVTALKVERDTALAALERAKSGARPAVDISPIVIERFGTTMREKLTSGEVPFRKAYLGALIDRVEVDDREIRIVGRKDVLEQAVLADGGPVPGVRSFVRRWRAGKDSNPRPPDS